MVILSNAKLCVCVCEGVCMGGRGSIVISVSHTPAVCTVPVKNRGSVSVTPTGEDSSVTKVDQFPWKHSKIFAILPNSHMVININFSESLK